MTSLDGSPSDQDIEEAAEAQAWSGVAIGAARWRSRGAMRLAGKGPKGGGAPVGPVPPKTIFDAALNFLRMAWPAVGIFCLAVPRPKRSGHGMWWAHETFTCHRAAAVRAVELAASRDVYFAIGTLKKERVWVPYTGAEKAKAAADGKLALEGRWSWRKQSNIDRLKCVFLDLDCGRDKYGKEKDYPSQREAGETLMRFLQCTGLPWPHVVDSGYGLHVYWIWDRALPADEWHAFAVEFHACVAENGLKVDRTRTLDRASVLRVPGTLNHKYGTTRAVRIMTPDEIGTWCAS